jgi:hypothetical protein
MRGVCLKILDTYLQLPPLQPLVLSHLPAFSRLTIFSQLPALSQQPASSQQFGSVQLVQSGVPQQHSPAEQTQTHLSQTQTHEALAPVGCDDDDKVLPENAKADTTQINAEAEPKINLTNIGYSPRKKKSLDRDQSSTENHFRHTESSDCRLL